MILLLSGSCRIFASPGCTRPLAKKIARATSASVAFGSLVEPRGEWSWRLCLEAGRYALRLEDSWGDGLCCEWGEGGWDAWVDDVWIGGGDGNYGEGVTKTFDVRVPEGTTYAPPP